jgi:KUP system potassium uptake protein
MSNNGASKGLLHLIVGSIGVVYGDIGTSPLYTLKECVTESQFPLNETTVLGILSLIFWAITLVVTFKYVLLILRADNHGEGGILALLALALRQKESRLYQLLFGIGIVGAALFYGDAIITPAISVLSAVEGLTVLSPEYQPYVVPIAVVILVGLFWGQHVGTSRIGSFFGPAMLVWFSVIGILGLIQIIKTPVILKAINPACAIYLFYEHGPKALLILSSVVLAITGAEALYADMGHFGRTAIQRAWFVIVFPSLAFNYLGQGALLLQDLSASENPFYYLVPIWGVFPLTLLSTVATIIASQAVISGIFSISWQAIQLGYLPRMRVVHTSAEHIGQVYVPVMNRALLALTILLVLVFKTSSDLASAYGFAVTGIMVITSLLTVFLAIHYWRWNVLVIIVVFGVFLSIDVLLFSMNTVKIFDGAWLPILIGFCLFTIMTTWARGRRVLLEQIRRNGRSLKGFMKAIKENPPVRIPGIAIYMSSTPEHLSNALVMNFRHNKILHEKVILLSLITLDVPFVPRAEKVKIVDLGYNIYKVIGYYGFKEFPSVSYILEKCDEQGLVLDLAQASFFMSRGIPIASTQPDLKGWREQLFIILAKNALSAADFFKIPHHRVMEIGIRVKV